MSRNTPFSRTFEVYLDYPEPFKSLRDELDGSEENLKDIAAGPDDLEKIQRAVRRVNEQIESLIWSCIEEVQTQGNAFAKVIAQTKGNRIFSGWMFDKLSLTRYRRKFISIGFYFGEKPRLSNRLSVNSRMRSDPSSPILVDTSACPRCFAA